ncbi:TIGR03943 family putative permease subunit [Niallia sp. 01092]|uniref:TIGR03943 family putative permease subunit n=1 Tax=unclassified Niallia TaxID=2837522 RepID=UPI003FCF2BCB
MLKIRWSPNWQFSNELQGIILISFSLLIFKLYVKNTLTLLIAPKMIPFLLFSMAALFLLGFFRLLNSNLQGADCDCDVCDQNTSIIKLLAPYLLFVSPLFFFFTIQDFSINKELLSTAGYISDTKQGTEQDLENIIVNKKLVVNDENFFMVMDLLNNKLDSLVGTEIEINGFIYREENFSANEAVIARQLMTHCVADTSIYGYLLSGDVQSLKTGSWYKVSAIIKKEEKDGGTMPVLQIKGVKQIEKPIEQYLYDL